jgi:hypothetical protein
MVFAVSIRIRIRIIQQKEKMTIAPNGRIVDNNTSFAWDG